MLFIIQQHSCLQRLAVKQQTLVHKKLNKIMVILNSGAVIEDHIMEDSFRKFGSSEVLRLLNPHLQIHLVRWYRSQALKVAQSTLLTNRPIV